MIKIIIFILINLLLNTALAAKDCNELLNEIKAKLDKKGVKNFELKIEDKNFSTDLKIVGTCEGGTKKITYFRK